MNMYNMCMDPSLANEEEKKIAPLKENPFMKNAKELFTKIWVFLKSICTWLYETLMKLF